ncbi:MULTISPECIES: cytochrome C oxidase subunit IV family protein [Geomicrobium]|uniref:Cytochrome c oxidase subunit 4 n=1 Tax=Geomicrobium sediminis TaxID=1347788 RepID=A0ABS2PI20_9BACL|nr:MULTISPECIES: cytochrome C oxidase subunit IV family protein [Geomicrobium]EZH67122.1 cytochrome C oxidase [Bacillaceae bacterium JMAK1]MBM7635077.1 cytochrome c oxidase subunit 4 [Geomicrobium sediminis]GAJ99680.1 cytochrome c oxidase, subunit IV [Geomicrobium sp. JCM 19055]GAK07390.1 cytochrome c oxidase, subunit IV [Geomicrobium sp. JCM 19038]
MGENLSQPFEKSSMTPEEIRKINREQRIQTIAFGFMIAITLLAFIAVGADVVPGSFAIPFILGLAGIQLFLQLYYFMHLKDKDHGWPNTFIVSGIVLVIPTIVALMLLIGVTKY